MGFINWGHFIDIYFNVQHPRVVFLLVFLLQMVQFQVLVVLLELDLVHLWVLLGLFFGFRELSLEVGDFNLVLLDFLKGVLVGGC